MQRQCQGTRCWLCLRNLGFSCWRVRSFGWYFWLQSPAFPNTWESGNMKTQCVRSNAETKFSAYTPISIKSFWVSDINIWDVCICSKLFCLQAARNYSVSIGTIMPFPALVILWKSMHLVVYALQVLISLLQLWSKLGKLSAKVFLRVKRWRQTRHNVLSDGTKCLRTANVACLHLYQSQWMSRAAQTLKQTLLGIQFCWNLVTRVSAHQDLEEIDSLLQRFCGQIRSNGIAFAHLAQTSANHQGTKKLFGLCLCIDWLLVTRARGESTWSCVIVCLWLSGRKKGCQRFRHAVTISWPVSPL